MKDIKAINKNIEELELEKEATRKSYNKRIRELKKELDDYFINELNAFLYVLSLVNSENDLIDEKDVIKLGEELVKFESETPIARYSFILEQLGKIVKKIKPEEVIKEIELEKPKKVK